MLKVIRRGVFETNSSSTHSITIVSKEDYDKWDKGELLLADGDSLVTKEEAVAELKEDKWFNKNNPDFDFTDKDEVNDALSENDYKTSEQYFEDEYLETFESNFTTKNGDKVVAFGKYGTDN